MNNKLLSLSAIFFCGCDSQKELDIKSKHSMENPEYVGDIQNQKLFRVWIYKYANHPHAVYFLNINSVVTVNTEVSSGGKNGKRSEIVVIIDGKQFIATPSEK